MACTARSMAMPARKSIRVAGSPAIHFRISRASITFKIVEAEPVARAPE